MQRRHGFTLVELMLVAVLVSLIAVYIGQALAANERAYQAVDQTSESQQHLRALLDLGASWATDDALAFQHEMEHHLRWPG